MLEVIYIYIKHIHPNIGIEDCRSRSERKQTRFKGAQLVRLCCCMPMYLAIVLAHSTPFLHLSSSPLFCIPSILRAALDHMLAPQANADSSLPVLQQGCDAMMLSKTSI